MLERDFCQWVCFGVWDWDVDTGGFGEDIQYGRDRGDDVVDEAHGGGFAVLFGRRDAKRYAAMRCAGEGTKGKEEGGRNSRSAPAGERGGCREIAIVYLAVEPIEKEPGVPIAG